MKRLKGFTLIELLIVVAIIAILAAIAVPNFLEAQTRAKVSRVRSDQRTLATALEAYYIDNNSYPAFTNADNQDNGPNINTGIVLAGQATGPLEDLPSFRVKEDEDNSQSGGNDYDFLNTLTTPVAYITSFFADPFADSPNAVFLYSVPVNAAGTLGTCWIVSSFGPDKDELSYGDIYLEDETRSFNGADIIVVEETLYSCTETPPSEVLVNRTYDPTNGTTSNGDVYRVKQ